MALAALAALGTVGAPAQADPPANPFAGSWSGTWAHVEDDDFGTADWTISDAGRITGTACNTAGECGTIVGHVDADGSLVVIASIGYPHKGTAVIDGEGRLVASATATGTGSGAVSFVAILERN